jgi:hypothetical protein
MSQQDLLKRVIEPFEQAGIDYMITGSVASSLQGEPRSTHDLDVVVQLIEEDVPALVAAFPPPNFYVDENAARAAVRAGFMFNMIEVGGGDKVDFWLLTNEPFDSSRFSRKVEVEVFGMRLKVSSPEDTILAKLWWAKLSGGSEKAYIDALRVFEVQGRVLDLGYIEEWVRRLGVGDLWARLEGEAEVI